MERALASFMDPALRTLLTDRRDQLVEDTGLDLEELVHIIAALPGDTLAAVEAEAGLSLTDAAWEYVERDGCWWQGVLIISDDGYGIVLFVPDRIDVDPELPDLLRRAAH
jgi:hypothetical protein